MEVRHINRSSSATHHPKVYTGAKSEMRVGQLPDGIFRPVHQFCSNLQQFFYQATSAANVDVPTKAGQQGGLELPPVSAGLSHP